MPTTPYVVGQWVRGNRFYGRHALIDEILEGPRNSLWLLGTRRVGKTSLLRQLEYLTIRDTNSVYVPIYWDFQGSDTPEELHAGFTDALVDAEEQLDALGIEVGAGADDVFCELGRLRRQLRQKGRKLLLLCDEVEELINLDKQAPSLLRKLRRAMQSQDDVRSVLSSTIRLWALSKHHGDTSPFLHGFLPPLYIGPMAATTSNALIRQTHLPGDQRPSLADDVAEKIRIETDGHPYLMQLISKRLLEVDDLDEALDQVATDPMVSHFFSVDFNLLTEREQRIIRVIAQQTSSSSRSIMDALSLQGEQLDGLLDRLRQLGFIRRDENKKFVLANTFFRSWFRERAGTGTPGKADAESHSVSLLEEAPNPAGRVGELIDDRYELLQLVGQGATGSVFRALDRVLRVEIALKLLRTEYAAHPEAFERFRQEIVLSREIVHPNVVTIYHLGDGEQQYLTMKWVDGTNLAELIVSEAPFDEARTLKMAACLADALGALHVRGVLHRDIKPANILVDKDGAPHLTDFGLARILGEPGMTQSGVFLGTPSYASPEQAGLRRLDERSDLYSLGLVLFEMCTGLRAFESGTGPEVLELQRTQRPPLPQERNPQVSDGLSALVLRCLEKDRERRYKTAGDLRDALKGLR